MVPVVLYSARTAALFASVRVACALYAGMGKAGGTDQQP